MNDSPMFRKFQSGLRQRSRQRRRAIQKVLERARLPSEFERRHEQGLPKAGQTRRHHRGGRRRAQGSKSVAGPRRSGQAAAATPSRKLRRRIDHRAAEPRPRDPRGGSRSQSRPQARGAARQSTPGEDRGHAADFDIEIATPECTEPAAKWRRRSCGSYPAAAAKYRFNSFGAFGLFRVFYSSRNCSRKRPGVRRWTGLEYSR